MNSITQERVGEQERWVMRCGIEGSFRMFERWFMDRFIDKRLAVAHPNRDKQHADEHVNTLDPSPSISLQLLS